MAGGGGGGWPGNEDTCACTYYSSLAEYTSKSICAPVCFTTFHTHTYAHTYMHTLNIHTHTHTHTLTHAHTHTLTHARTHTFTHACKHSYIHAHTHMQTLIHTHTHAADKLKSMFTRVGGGSPRSSGGTKVYDPSYATMDPVPHNSATSTPFTPQINSMTQSYSSSSRFVEGPMPTGSGESTCVYLYR